MDDPLVIVELFGVARHRAGVAELSVRGVTIGELIQAVASACPKLGDLLSADGSLSRRYLVSIDGCRFVADLTESIPANARVLILGAEAGG